MSGWSVQSDLSTTSPNVTNHSHAVSGADDEGAGDALQFIGELHPKLLRERFSGGDLSDGDRRLKLIEFQNDAGRPGSVTLVGHRHRDQDVALTIWLNPHVHLDAGALAGGRLTNDRGGGGDNGAFGIDGCHRKGLVDFVDTRHEMLLPMECGGGDRDEK